MQEFSRDEDEIISFLNSDESYNMMDDSGEVTNVFLASNEVMKVRKSPSLLCSVEEGYERRNALERNEIPSLDLEIYGYDLSDAADHYFPRDAKVENFERYEEETLFYGEECPVIFQDRADNLIEEVDRKVIENLLDVIDDAADAGIAFPDNSLSNWAYSEGEIVRLDVTDKMSIVVFEDQDISRHERKNSFKTLVGSLRENRIEDPIDDIVSFAHDKSEFYGSFRVEHLRSIVS